MEHEQSSNASKRTDKSCLDMIIQRIMRENKEETDVWERFATATGVCEISVRYEHVSSGIRFQIGCQDLRPSMKRVLNTWYVD